MRESALPEVNRAAHQKTTIPVTGERNCPRPRQDEYVVPERGHYGTPRGLGGIFGWPPGGPQPVCHSCQEGHNHAKRYSAGMPHQRGEELKQP